MQVTNDPTIWCSVLQNCAKLSAVLSALGRSAKSAMALGTLVVATSFVGAQQPPGAVQGTGMQSGIVAVGSVEQGNANKGSPGGVVAAVPDAFSGALATAIPLRLPPGTKSPLTQLSVTYNSRRGNGPVGVGWSLELPQITIAQGRDSGSSSVQYIFQNGSESIDLIRKNGEEFQARIERSFLRFYRRSAPDGRVSWEVRTRQGIRLILGGDEQTRVSISGETEPRAWFLSEANDPFGNRMVLTYLRDTTDALPLPQLIVFDNPTRPAILPRSIALKYEKRADTIGIALPGTQATLVVRLSTIRTTIGAATYDTLSFSYEDRAFSVASAAASLLSQVALTTAAPAALPLRIASFRYGPAVNAIETAELNTQPFAFGSIADQCLFGNFSGNGRTEIICYLQGQWQKAQIETNGISAVALSGAPTLDQNLNLKSQCLAGDFLGRGQSSIACYVKSKAYWVVMNLTTSNAFSSLDWMGAEPTGQCLVLDLNNDGKSDIACQSSDANARGHWQVSLSTGTSWSTTVWSGGPVGGFQPAAIQQPGGGGVLPLPVQPYAQAYCLTGDFDGNRRVDVACYRNDLQKWDVGLSTGAGWRLELWDGPIPENEKEVAKKCLALDFDGNGRADIACASGASDWTLALSFSTGRQLVSWTKGPVSTFAENCLIGDMNGDGKPDFACNSAKSSAWTLALNTGSGWQTQDQTWVDLVGREARNACFSRESGLQKTELYCARADGVYERMRSAGTYTQLLRTVVNTLGGRTEVDYGSSADTVNPRMPAMPVVTQIRNDNGAGLSAMTTFAYANGLFVPVDRSFRGFSEVTTRTTGHSQTETASTRREFFQGAIAADGKDDRWVGVPYLRGREKVRDVLDSTNKPITRQTFNYKAAGAAPYFSPLQETTTYSCLTDCQPVQIDSFEVDINGSVTTETRTYRGPSAPASRRIERTFVHSNDASLIGFPETETVLSGDRSRVVSQTRFLYDAADDCNGSSGTSSLRQGLVTRIERIQEDGNAIRTDFGYDSIGNLTCVRNPRGFTTRFDLEPATGFVSESRNALGHTTRYKYFGVNAAEVAWFGQLRQVDGPDGIVMRTEYDTFRRPAAAYINQRPEPFRRTTFSQVGDPLRQTTTETDVLGLAKVTRFDGVGNVVESLAAMTADLSVRTSEQWLPGSARLSKRLPSFVGQAAGAQSRFSYDSAGRLARIDHPSGRSSRICYVGLVEFKLEGTRVARAVVRTSTGQAVEYVAFSGVAARTCADVFSLVGSDLAIKPSSRVVARRVLLRDELERIIEVRDGDRKVFSRTYDQLGRLRVDDDVDRGRTTYEYDSANNLIRRQDATMRSVSTSYDAIDRARTVDTSLDSATKRISLRYDDRGARSIGKLTAVEADGTLETLDYDDEGRPSKISTTVEGVELRVSKTFDSAGRVESIRYPDGLALQYVYDGHFLRKIAVGGKTFATFDRPTPLGQYQRLTFANGLVRDLSFSEPENTICPRPGFLLCSDSLRDAGGKVVSARKLIFDDRARLIQLDDDRPNLARVSNRFYYDDADRLTAHATRPLGSTWSGVTPPVTDLTLLPPSAVPDSYRNSEPGANWLSIQAYDSAGNITWSMRNGLFGYSGGASPQPNAIQSVVGQPFSYDAAGRAQKAMDIGIEYDGSGRVSAVTQAAMKSTFSFAGSGELRQFQLAGQPRRLVVGQHAECVSITRCRNSILAGREVIGVVDEGVVAFTHRDHLGSVREVSDKAGQIDARLAYGAYGDELVSRGGTSLKYRSFAGGQALPGGTAHRMGPRIYMPRVGRFLSPDQIVNMEGMPFETSSYAYAFNRPTYYADPDGDFAWAIVAVAAFIGGVQASQHGDNILEGALRGAVFGAFIASGYAVIGASGAGAFGQGVIMAYAGAFGGATEAAIWGGDPGQAAQAGAISAVGGLLLGGMEVNVFGSSNGLAGTANYVTASALKGAALSAMYAAATGRDVRESATQGAEAGALGAIAASAVHHAGSIVATGKLPRWDSARQVYVYNMKGNWLGAEWPGFSLGNVVSSDSPSRVIGSMPGRNTLDHEASHAWKQSTALGPAWGYLGSHVVAGMASLVFADASCWNAGLDSCTHEANVLEAQGGWIDVPYK